MIKVGILGLGMMGLTHLDVYRQLANVQIVALADWDPRRLYDEEKASGNIEGQAQRGVSDLVDVQRFESCDELIATADADLIDICLPTDLHIAFGITALEAGKHVIVEKPVARTFAEGQRLAEVARRVEPQVFVAQCMRFWPGWTWLKDAIDNQTHGRVLAATFRRMVSHPGGPFYSDGGRCGGAALDLHIHDTDFIQYCFGLPESVTGYGYTRQTNHPDHIVTHYHYEDVPLVMAEGSWALAEGFGFSMGYCVNFESATAVFDSTAKPSLTITEPGSPPRAVELEAGSGYDHEIQYFIDCIENSRPAQRVTLSGALDSVRIVEAEIASLTVGKTISLG